MTSDSAVLDLTDINDSNNDDIIQPLKPIKFNVINNNDNNNIFTSIDNSNQQLTRKTNNSRIKPTTTRVVKLEPVNNNNNTDDDIRITRTVFTSHCLHSYCGCQHVSYSYSSSQSCDNDCYIHMMNPLFHPNCLDSVTQPCYNLLQFNGKTRNTGHHAYDIPIWEFPQEIKRKNNKHNKQYIDDTDSNNQIFNSNTNNKKYKKSLILDDVNTVTTDVQNTELDNDNSVNKNNTESDNNSSNNTTSDPATALQRLDDAISWIDNKNRNISNNNNTSTFQALHDSIPISRSDDELSIIKQENDDSSSTNDNIHSNVIIDNNELSYQADTDRLHDTNTIIHNDNNSTQQQQTQYNYRIDNRLTPTKRDRGLIRIPKTKQQFNNFVSMLNQQQLKYLYESIHTIYKPRLYKPISNSHLTGNIYIQENQSISRLKSTQTSNEIKQLKYERSNNGCICLPVGWPDHIEFGNTLRWFSYNKYNKLQHIYNIYNSVTDCIRREVSLGIPLFRIEHSKLGSDYGYGLIANVMIPANTQNIIDYVGYIKIFYKHTPASDSDYITSLVDKLPIEQVPNTLKKYIDIKQSDTDDSDIDDDNVYVNISVCYIIVCLYIKTIVMLLYNNIFTNLS